MKISSLPFYNTLSPSGRNLLMQSLLALSCERGQLLHESGDGSYGMIYVEEGTVSVSLGKGITLLRLRRGDVCFLTATETLPELAFGLNVTAETDARILSLSDEYLSLLMKRDPEFSRYVHRAVMCDFSSIIRLLESVLFDSIEKRIAVFLTEELRSTGSDTLHLTHQQIAESIGTAREVVTRVLKRFTGEGILTLGRGSLTVMSREKLKRKTR